MSGIDLKRFLNSFGKNYPQQMLTGRSTINSTAQTQLNQTSQMPPAQTTGAAQASNTASSVQIVQNLQLNALQNMDRAVYAKEVMQLPKNINEFIYMLQKGLTQAQFNQMFANQLAAQRNNLSQIQAQILAQLQGLTTTINDEMVNIQIANQLQTSLKKLEILSGGMINLSDISTLLQKNGKEALTKLIMSMTEASKAGITDLSQMKEMAKLINASISVAAENNPQKNLKLL